jgi:hypothetical protein
MSGREKGKEECGKGGGDMKIKEIKKGIRTGRKRIEK